MRLISENWLPSPVLLPRESDEQRSLKTTVHRIEKSRTQLNRISTAHINENGLVNSTACLLVLRGNPSLQLLPKGFLSVIQPFP